MTKTAEIYQSGNPFQNRVYKKMSDYLQMKGVSNFGTSQKRDTPYRHLLPPESTFENFLYDRNIFLEAKSRFKDHKAGDWDRARTNTAASQPCCFNLFVPLQQDLKLASRLFSSLMDSPVVVGHIEIEFTPNTPNLDALSEFERHSDESIGDQGPEGSNQGTDADVAVFYKTKDRKGVILIEYKYIEADFNLCYSYKTKAKDLMKCSTSGFYKEMIEMPLRINRNLACGYLKYGNWSLTNTSDLIDIEKIRSLSGCPFRYSLNQIWRNFLLAETVKKARSLDDCHFWVLAPEDNTNLWNNHKEMVEDKLRKILTDKGRSIFKKLKIEDVVECLENMGLSTDHQKWLVSFREKYLFSRTTE
jgi:hypothetical protein